MHTFNELLKHINQAIDDLDFDKQPLELYEPIEYILSLGGKRIRPISCLMSCEMFGGDFKRATSPAIGMEMFHNFTLVHDDIMDHASMRRGKPTVHFKWNENRAILSGDAMLILANKLMLNVEDHLVKEVMHLYNDTGLKVCDGQQLDMNFENSKRISMPEYLKMIELKTAVLLAGCLRLGAVLANASDEHKDLIEEFGNYLGLSFQIEDDYLDSFGDFDKFGKNIGGDILVNKKTFLLVKAVELADRETLKEIDGWLSVKEFVAGDKIEGMINIYKRLGVDEIAVKDSKYYFDLAIQKLEQISIPFENKAEIKNFAALLLNRES